MRVVGVGLVGTRAVPQRGDDLGDAEREKCTEAGCGDAVAPVARAPLAAREEQRRQQDQEKHLAVLGDEAEHLLERVVPVGEAVEVFVEVEVHGADPSFCFEQLQRTLHSSGTMSWVLLSYKLPSNNSSARVAVWREVRRSGALNVQRSVVAFPDHEAFRRAVERFRLVVAEAGGETLALRAEPLGELDATKLTVAWNEARSAEYAELRAECGKFLTEIEHEFEIEKFTLAELEEEEAELDKLQRWHARIEARDIHNAPGAQQAREALTQAQDALERYSTAVFERTQL